MAKKSSGRPARRNQAQYADDGDDIDAFQAQREKIALDSDEDRRLDGSDGDFDEAVLDLPTSGSEDEVDETWGRNKKTFYTADTAVEDLEDEAKEARKLQKKQLQQLNEEDFGRVKKSSASLKSGIVSLDLSDDDEEDEEMEDDKFASESEIMALDSDKLEKLLPEEDKLALIQKHTPEVRKFLEEFRKTASDISNSVEPVLVKLRESKSADNGLSFLETKYQLLMGYCANLAYYLLLKVKGRSIEKHPVIERLVKYRLLIEKIKPMEAKLQYQVDKLLHAAANSTSKTNSANVKADEVALSFRPNVDLMEASESDGSDAEATGVYKAPKVAPVHFNQSSKKTERAEEREKLLASRSRLLADIQADIEDRPEEDSIDPVYGGRMVKANKSTEAYEEDNFVRVTISKKEQRKMDRMQAKPVDELEDLNDFFKEQEKAPRAGKSAVDRLLGSTKNNKTKFASGDEDMPAKRAKNYNNTKSKSGHKDEEVASDMSEIEDDMNEDSFYKKAKNNKLAKKTSNSSGPVNYKRLTSATDNNRPATREMIKNKGLTPSRPKEVRNPRVRQRQKWENAQKKIKSFKSVASTSDKPYSGESSGIRTNLSRSVKFNR